MTFRNTSAGGLTPSSIATILAVVALYVLPLAGSPPAMNPNELVRVEQALATALWASVDLGPAAEVYGLSEDVAVRDGRIYSDKAPGLALMAVPLIWLGQPVLPERPELDAPEFWPLRHLLTLLLVALPTALLPFVLLMRSPTVPESRRLPTAALLALATPLWPYATVFFGHAPAAVLVGCAWLLLVGAPGTAGSPTPRKAFLGSVAAGLAVSTEYPTVLIVGVIAATVLGRRPSRQALWRCAPGLLLGLLPALLYHTLAFGAPWLTGYSFKAEADFAAIHSSGVLGVATPTFEGLWGVLFSAHRGLLFYSPLLVLAVVGTVRNLRSRSPGAVAMTVAILTYTTFAAGFVDWQAGWCTAARHLLPILPLLILATAEAMVALTARTAGAVVVGVLAVVSVANSTLSLALTPFFPPEVAAPFAQLVLPSLAEGLAAPTLLSVGLGLPAVAVWIAIGAVALVVAWHGVARGTGRARTMAVTCAITLVLYGALLAGAAARRSDEHEPGRAWLLQRLGHPAQTAPHR